MKRTRESLFKELDGIKRVQTRKQAELDAGTISLRAYQRAADMTHKQWLNVVKHLGPEGIQAYTLLQLRRVEQKVMRERRQRLETMRASMYGKQHCIAAAKHAAHMRECNGQPSLNQATPYADHIESIWAEGKE